MKRTDDGFLGIVEDCWVERWPGTVAATCGGEDACFAVFRVMFSLTREQAIALLGEGNLPRLPIMESASATEDMPRNGQRWRLARVEEGMSEADHAGARRQMDREDGR